MDLAGLDRKTATITTREKSFNLDYKSKSFRSVNKKVHGNVTAEQ